MSGGRASAVKREESDVAACDAMARSHGQRGGEAAGGALAKFAYGGIRRPGTYAHEGVIPKLVSKTLR